MSSQSTIGSALSSFRCVYPGCRSSYQRREHLNRHLTRHNQDQRFCCPHCTSTLARSDLLRRHVRNYHPDRRPPPSRTQKACSNCHVRKERCDGGSPCGRCERRGVACSRLSPEIPQEDRNTPETHELLTTDLVASMSNASRWVGQDFIDIYFNDFHPVWPFLHRGTFNLPKEPCILLQSMLMIGLWIKGDREARNTAMNLHQRLLSAIQVQKDQWYVAESTQPRNNNNKPWPMATYQSILLQLIFALLAAKQETMFDLNLRCPLSSSAYELLTSLVATCRRLGLFSYPNMLAQHDPTAPVALVWVSVEETKRFGLALYKLCRACSQTSTDRTGSTSGLLTLADLDFCIPDSDERWNASSDVAAEGGRLMGLQQACRDNRSPSSWISHASVHLHDARVNLDWI
ncbi:Zn(II)2Cys6 transcription factor [Aspergillus homomorphus CBS 101889]|uniref:C6 and C2H2 transcription factor n=1 Tax=Aspergillus homomorphus (strain CBS 101889) TaxID=1450537 RepID=A0A395HXG6_ASPHC|nr:C6 and C2H2 transcription factor [Aspergillus homomorphus CBS 101889]RAL10934.1 C6 and C2H2 transcription factor [Aspergillus homomorphus CBS 101889]